MLFVITAGSVSLAQEIALMDQLLQIQDSGSANIKVSVDFSVQDTLDEIKLSCAFDDVSTLQARLLPDDQQLTAAHTVENGIPFVRINHRFLPGSYKLEMDVVVHN